MIAPKIPGNEAERLSALHEYHILDTGSEVEFDDITKLASSVCGTPISLISLIDEDRLWVKSNYGLDVSETLREVGLCAHLVDGVDDVLEVEDTLQDERFHDNPLVKNEPHVRFYAGSPLIDSNGFCLGSLCVIDKEPRKLDKGQRDMLQFLSKQATAQLELRKKNYELELANDQIKNEQKRLKEIVEHVGDIIYELNDKGQFIYVNPAIVKISGYSEKTLLKSFFWELAAPGTEEDLGRFYLGIIKRQIKSSYHEFQMRTKNGSVWVGQNVEIEYEGKRATHVYAVARDIDDLVKARIELAENAKKYELISENSKDVISLHERDGTCTFVSPSIKKLLGYEVREIMSKKAFELFHPDDLKKVVERATEDLSNRAELRKVECRLKRKDGTYLWVEGNAVRVKDDKGKTVGFQASTRNISDRKEKEFELRKNNAKLEGLINNTTDAVCVIERHFQYFRFASFNRGSKSQIAYLIGFQPEEGRLVGFKHIHSKLPGFKGNIEKAFEGEKLNELYSFEQDGLTWYMDCHFNPIYDQDNKIFALALQIRDVSEKMRLSEQSDLHRYNLELLNEIISNSSISANDQIQSILDITLKYLDLELGVVSKINEGKYEITHSLQRQTNVMAEIGGIFDLDNSFCEKTYKEITPVSVHKTNEVDYHAHPCYIDSDLRSYVGCPYFISGELMGTVNFTSRQSRYDPFDDAQVSFVNLLARWVGFLIERAEHKEKLSRERDVLKAFVSSAPAAIAMFDKEFRYLEVSKKWLNSYSVKRRDVLGKSYFHDFPKLKNNWDPILNSVLDGNVQRNDEYQLKLLDGKERWLKWEMQPWFKSENEVGGIMFITEDITIQVQQKRELEKAETDLKQSEERYRLLSENSRDIISLTDKDGNYKFLSSAVKEILGYEYQELIGENAFNVTHPDDASRMRNDKTGLDKIESSSGTFITRIRKKNGEYIWMESIIRAIRNDENKIDGYQVSSRDISQRNAHEQNIILNQARIEALIENTNDAICVIDKERKYLSFNNSFQKQMQFFNGFAPVVGDVFDIESVNAQSPGFKLSVERAMRNNKFAVLQSFEKDGRQHYFDCYYNPVTDHEGQIFGLTIRIQDVTEKTERTIKSELFRKSTESLNELFAQSDFSLYEQVNQALIIALEYFQLDIIGLSSVDEDRYTIDYCSARSKEIPIKARDTFLLKDMYCNDVYNKSIFQTIDQSNEDDFKNHYSRKKLKLKAYIGAPYFVNNQKRGTVWLASSKSKNLEFGDQEIEFINMLARSMGFLIERHEYRDQLLSEQIVLKAFVFSAPASIAMFNENLEYIAVSKKWKQEYKLIEPEILSKYYGDLSPHLKKSWDSILKECLKGQVEKNDCFKTFDADGSEQWLKWEIRPWTISENNVGGVIMFTEDITNQIRQQEELKQAKELAESASKSKEQFLSTMSHEIRTPMNAIIGSANLLLHEQPKPEQLDNLNLLKFSSDTLLSLINDILDFNKIEAGKIDFEEIDFNLKDLIIGIKQSLKFKAEEKGVDLILKYDDELPDVFIGDSIRISQILNNLIGNAIKFTEEGFVKIEVIGNGQSGKRTNLTFRIQDTGVGIAKEDRQKIFEEFSQASDDITRKYGGTGLGLAITKRLLELMGSSINVASKKGRGTIFYFDLALIASRASSFVPSEVLKMNGHNSASAEGIHILVAEDNDANRKIIGQFLQRWNLNIDFAENGIEAIECVKNKKYDLVFMDLRMPEMDGYDATINIRKIQESYYQNIPIIALTASATTDIRNKAKEIGMNDFISKPFNPDEVHQKIIKYVGRYDGAEPNIDSTSANDTKAYANSFPYLYQISDGNESMITDIIRSVIETVPEELDKLETLLKEKNFELFAEIIHKIKPNLTSLELSYLVSVADELEEAAELSDELKVTDMLPSFLANIRLELEKIDKRVF